MTVFRSRGFDSIIGGQLVLSANSVEIPANSTLLVEGTLSAHTIQQIASEKVASKTTLRVSGTIKKDSIGLNITVHNVIITGKVECDEIRAEGCLAVKAGSTLKAGKIYYRELIVETGAVMTGQMLHLDHVSEGEQT